MKLEVDRGVRSRIEAWFFHNFFVVLLFLVSTAEAGVAWWVAKQWWHLGAGAFLLLATAISAFNLWIVRRRRTAQRNLVDRLPRLYHATAFTCLFCAGFLVANHLAWRATSLAHALVTAEARGMAKPKKPLRAGPIDERATGWLGVVGIAALFAYGYTFGQRQLRVQFLRVPLNTWPTTAPPLRIVQLSDIHVGTNMTPTQLASFVAQVNRLHPDLVCITGDIADNAQSELDLYFPILGQLESRLGVVAVLGNHDHYAGAERVVQALRRHTAFVILRDHAISISQTGARVHIVGLDDRGRDWARGVPAVPQLEALSKQLPPGEPRILLCHRPDVFPQAAQLGFDLVLSGHTHGGQIAFPWTHGRTLSLAQLVTSYDRGLFRNGSSTLYVNCGLGVTGQRIRLFTPREITVIEICAAAGIESATAAA